MHHCWPWTGIVPTSTWESQGQLPAGRFKKGLICLLFNFQFSMYKSISLSYECVRLPYIFNNILLWEYLMHLIIKVMQSTRKSYKLICVILAIGNVGNTIINFN
jgi:hypothetical protein